MSDDALRDCEWARLKVRELVRRALLAIAAQFAAEAARL
jgi:hypothetical protein